MNQEELIRYSRMIAIPEIGREGMEKLRETKVMIVGCGALGSVCAMYLAGAGVGEITIADFDTIDISNLQRQLFFESAQAGESKAAVLAERIKALNPDITIKCLQEMITSEKAMTLFADKDFIIDATDNPSSKTMTDGVCQKLGIPYCIGGVSGFKGQAMSWQPGCAAYTDIFSPQTVCSGFTPCSLGGVLGPAAGVVACIQASEAIKHLTGVGEMLYNKIFMIDLLTMESHTLSVE